MPGDDEKVQFCLITGLLKDLRITYLYVHLNLTALTFDLGAYLQSFSILYSVWTGRCTETEQLLFLPAWAEQPVPSPSHTGEQGQAIKRLLELAVSLEHASWHAGTALSLMGE